VWWHRVATVFGCPVAEAQERLTSAEFTDWIYYLRHEPQGYHGLAKVMATLCATVWNASIQVKRRKQLKPSDFLSDFQPPLKTAKAARAGKLSPRHQAALERRKKRSGRNRGNSNS
jgi:hypothetical protein